MVNKDVFNQSSIAELYRAKSIKTEKMVYGSYLYRPGAVWEHQIYNSSEGVFHFIDVETLSRYVGISDINGNLIFENDIVKVPVRRIYDIYDKEDDWSNYITKCVSKLRSNLDGDIVGGYYLSNLPITRREIEELEHPRGKEQKKRIVDLSNVRFEDCEIIGNIFENKDLIGE